MTLLYPPTANGIQKTLASQLDQGFTDSATLNNTTNIQNKPGVMLIDRIDTSGKEKEAAVREYISFTGVSGSTLTGLTRNLGGTTDQDHALSAVVEFVQDVVQQQAILDYIADLAPKASPVLSGTITGTYTIGGTPTFPATVVSTTGTQTLINKRITPRIVSATSYTTDTGTSLNCDTTDMFIVTAQAGDLKFNNPGGTPTDGQKLIITVASSTTAARALTWDTAYGATTTALPTTTAATTVTLSIGFIWSASKSLWQCVAVA